MRREEGWRARLRSQGGNALAQGALAPDKSPPSSPRLGGGANQTAQRQEKPDMDESPSVERPRPLATLIDPPPSRPRAPAAEAA